MIAWHFLPGDRKLKYGDNRKVKLGETLACDVSELELCSYGLHASLTPLDALQYLAWENAVLCKVKFGGLVLFGDGKVVASERTVIEWCNADNLLHEFACRCAEEVLPLFEKRYPGDLRPRRAIEVKRKWVQGEITREELSAAGDAAWDAAWAAAWAAAGDAAWAAAEAAAKAAKAAAWAAAGDAAWAAAEAAARETQNKLLIQMFNEETKLL